MLTEQRRRACSRLGLRAVSPPRSLARRNSLCLVGRAPDVSKADQTLQPLVFPAGLTAAPRLRGPGQRSAVRCVVQVKAYRIERTNDGLGTTKGNNKQ